ncbi:HSP90 family protein [Cellulomonas xiejunii]|uniref:HSP90 family protein n=1 Tax=Cellulomonas xiejunii TaxID=2968083 RepID=UPI001D0E9590|nr:HSP90 family protein [Cellulomonas xiejunii]MCC2314418.1 HSP90 family protein [Cellulomonas xiejunii]
MSATEVDRAFQVDLRGVVDLLARHLYSGPHLYLRELLQNAVDAITARRAVDPGAPATVRVRPLEDGGLEVVDTGIGLTVDEACDLLATIGRSSKRDEHLGSGRPEFLGQFGIGLLAAFMVAEEIDVVSRSAVDPQAPAVRWRGFDDGRFSVAPCHDDVAPGTTVRLRPRADTDHWFTEGSVVALAEEYGGLLPVDVAVEVVLEPPGPRPPDGTAADRPTAWRRTSARHLPWRTSGDEASRTRALADYCERVFGLRPLAHIDLQVPLAGVEGVAFVMPVPVAQGTSVRHRVYLKRMLLGSRVDGLLPDWAVFVRCVVDARALRPTASREALYENEVLMATREALGAAVREWTLQTLRSWSPLTDAFVAAHDLALRALATSDQEMLELVAHVLPYETTDGTSTLEEVRATHGRVLYAPTLQEYRRVAAVARAEGLAVVNAGYVYDADVLARLAARPGWDVQVLGRDDVQGVLSPPPPELLVWWSGVEQDAERVLAPLECAPLLRTFGPTSLPALLLDGADARFERLRRRLVEERQDVWAEVLESLDDVAPPAERMLVLNGDNAVVLALADVPPGPVRDAGLRALYVQATLQAGEPLRARDAEVMTASLEVLLRAGLAPGSRPQDGLP